jgi:hypothetical protein
LALGNPQIDYFSLDIEGAEMVVLETVPWDKVNMTLLSIEMNHAGDIFPGTKEDIHNFLASKGYTFKGTATIDDFFLREDLLAKATTKKATKKSSKPNKSEIRHQLHPI